MGDFNFFFLPFPPEFPTMGIYYMSYLEINANTHVEINNLILHSFNKQVLQSSISRHGRVLNRFRACSQEP